MCWGGVVLGGGCQAWQLRVLTLIGGQVWRDLLPDLLFWVQHLLRLAFETGVFAGHSHKSGARGRACRYDLSSQFEGCKTNSESFAPVLPLKCNPLSIWHAFRRGKWHNLVVGLIGGTKHLSKRHNGNSMGWRYDTSDDMVCRVQPLVFERR